MLSRLRAAALAVGLVALALVQAPASSADVGDRAVVFGNFDDGTNSAFVLGWSIEPVSNELGGLIVIDASEGIWFKTTDLGDDIPACGTTLDAPVDTQDGPACLGDEGTGGDSNDDGDTDDNGLLFIGEGTLNVLEGNMSYEAVIVDDTNGNGEDAFHFCLDTNRTANGDEGCDNLDAGNYNLGELDGPGTAGTGGTVWYWRAV